jgi:hypothetical protein
MFKDIPHFCKIAGYLVSMHNLMPKKLPYIFLLLIILGRVRLLHAQLTQRFSQWTAIVGAKQYVAQVAI